MPRIRSIKPEFWTSGQVLECSTNARLLFIGLWNFCDDQGRHALRAKQIKAEVFPADDFTADDILGMIDELAANDLITLYEHESQQFFQVNGWHHQRIDKPQAPKFPDPFDDHSKIIRGTLPPDRKGKDRKGERGANAPPAPKSKGCRIPDNFPAEPELKWAEAEHPSVDAKTESAKFRDYWSGVAGQKATKADWPATWRNWIRRCVENKPAEPRPPAQRYLS